MSRSAEGGRGANCAPLDGADVRLCIPRLAPASAGAVLVLVESLIKAQGFPSTSSKCRDVTWANFAGAVTLGRFVLLHVCVHAAGVTLRDAAW